MLLMMLEEFKDRKWHYRPEFNFVSDNNLHTAIILPNDKSISEIKSAIGHDNWTDKNYPPGGVRKIQRNISEISRLHTNVITVRNISVEKLLKANWRKQLNLTIFLLFEEYFNLFVLEETTIPKNVKIQRNWQNRTIGHNNILIKTNMLDYIKDVLKTENKLAAWEAFCGCFPKNLNDISTENVEIECKVQIQLNEVMRPFLKDCLYPLYLDLKHPEKARYTAISYV